MEAPGALHGRFPFHHLAERSLADCLWLDIGADFHFIPSSKRLQVLPPTVSLMMVAIQLNSLRGNFVGLVSPAVFKR